MKKIRRKYKKGGFVTEGRKIYFIDQKGLKLSDKSINEIVEAMRKLKESMEIVEHYFGGLY